uniref:Uncharacterized protein n=1 Tax=Rhizophora mucronata TaxID=61149 RepID=A0A2P2JFH5_RHIMU
MMIICYENVMKTTIQYKNLIILQLTNKITNI